MGALGGRVSVRGGAPGSCFCSWGAGGATFLAKIPAQKEGGPGGDFPGQNSLLEGHLLFHQSMSQIQFGVVPPHCQVGKAFTFVAKM